MLVRDPAARSRGTRSVMAPAPQRPFLKYAGNKFRCVAQIAAHAPAGRTLIEPFVGSGAVFLNLDYPRYLLNDANPDLIHLYRTLQRHGERFIADAAEWFVPKNNTPAAYYRHRTDFNRRRADYRKALLMLYLARFGYNGLFRYGPNGFNVPFGRYAQPYFPEAALRAFHARAQRATFYCGDFRAMFRYARHRTICYCDPPYVARSAGGFNAYLAAGFDDADQIALVACARTVQARGATVLISNHDTPATRRLYRDARCVHYPVARTISCRATTRRPVNELLACYRPPP